MRRVVLVAAAVLLAACICVAPASAYDGLFAQDSYRNRPLWQIPIELRTVFPELPILCDPSHISGNRELILGHLADYETVTGYHVTPVVGWVEPPFPLIPDPVEVADVFEVPLSFLLDSTNQKRHFRMLGEIRRDYFAIPFRERYIWGATAAMLMILDRTLRAGRDTSA